MEDILLQLNNCKNFVGKLLSTFTKIETVVCSFKEFCCQMIEFLSAVTQFIQSKMKILRDSIMLHLTQLLSLLRLTVHLFTKEQELNEILVEIRRCVLNQITCCLEGLQEVLTSDNVILINSGSFMKWMDAALDSLAEINIEDGSESALIACNTSRKFFEEVLCYGMSIAQVALQEDCKKIRGGSQSVLTAFETLTSEVEKPNPNRAMCNLFIDACTDKLCTLERKVNTAVLRLSLKVFSQCTRPLLKLEKYCLSNESKCRIEMDDLVAEFDLHVDQIIQIGLFAVACSTNTLHTVRMRSCLASLEALEGELVPSLTAVSINNSTHNIYFAQFLKNYWIEQAELLRHLIYLIIDPSAYCQVVYEENKLIIEELLETTEPLQMNSLEGVFNNSEMLLQMISATSNEKEMKMTKHQKIEYNSVKNILHELRAAVNLPVDEVNVNRNKRILKRCKILLKVIKSFWLTVSDPKDDDKIDEITQYSDNGSNNSTKNYNNPFLDHIINRGKQILKERSILYRTPIKATEKKISVVCPESTGVNKQIRTLTFSNSSIHESSLHLSDLLDEIQSLSATFNNLK